MSAQLPQAFVERMAARLKDELPAFLRSYEEPYCRGIRFQPGKLVPPAAWPAGVGEQIPWEPAARYLAMESDAGTMVLHEAGGWYLQEPSAMAPVAALNPQPGERVLDLCAAPGGKSTQIAAHLGGKGLLVSNEPVPKRAAVLSRNLERMGVTNALAVSAYPDQLAAQWPAYFDAVLVDAPYIVSGSTAMAPPASRNPGGMVSRGTSRLRQASAGNSGGSGAAGAARRTDGVFHLHAEHHGKRRKYILVSYGAQRFFCVPVSAPWRGRHSRHGNAFPPSGTGRGAFPGAAGKARGRRGNLCYVVRPATSRCSAHAGVAGICLRGASGPGAHAGRNTGIPTGGVSGAAGYPRAAGGASPGAGEGQAVFSRPCLGTVCAAAGMSTRGAYPGGSHDIPGRGGTPGGRHGICSAHL